MNCLYCSSVLGLLIHNLYLCSNCFFNKAICSLCHKQHIGHAVFIVENNEIAGIKFGITKIMKVYTNPKYLGPMDTIDPYIIDRTLFSVELDLNKNITRVSKLDFNMLPMGYETLLFTISGISKINPCTFEQILPKIHLYITFS